MKNQIFHVFRNTPFGRERFLQSLHFSRLLGLHLKVYVPIHREFLMYFPNGVVTVTLNRSYLRDPATAQQHAEALIGAAGVEASFLVPKRFTAEVLPDIPVEHRFMCCPRSMGDLSSRVGLSHLGPRVRSIVMNAAFPVILPGQVYKEWKSVVVFFGGSIHSIRALLLGLRIRKATGMPLTLFTQSEGKDRAHYERALAEHDMLSPIEGSQVEWRIFERGEFVHNLYEVPHDALVLAGAFGQGVIKGVLFGSKLERIQSVLPNTLVIVGPSCVDTPF